MGHYLKRNSLLALNLTNLLFGHFLFILLWNKKKYYCKIGFDREVQNMVKTKVQTFDESDVWAALIIASLLVRLNGIAIESNTFIASSAARWNASEMRVG